jgi:hypothetical protein
MLFIWFLIHNRTTANKYSDATFYESALGNNSAVSTKSFIVGVFLDRHSSETQESVGIHLNVAPVN